MNKLMDAIVETVKGLKAESRYTPLEYEIRKYILNEFARKGSPPTAEEIRERLGLHSTNEVNQAIEKLEMLDTLSRKGERIISAYPFSALETRHKVVFGDGHEVHALCATDALGIHFMLNQDITILSRCPECERELRVVVKAGQIDSYSPEGIIELVSASNDGCGCAAEAICPFINLFCSEEHLEEWRMKNPEHRTGETYSLSEALEHGKAIFGDFLK